MGGQGSGRRPSPAKSTPESLNEWRTGKVVQLLAHDRLKTVPDADLPLSDQGALKYRELAEMLLKAGQLTVITKAQAETAAMAFQEMHSRQSRGVSVSANLIQRYQTALANLQLLDIDKNTPGAAEQKKNRFRFSGFASRLS